MKIYENLTFKTNNLEEILILLKKKKTQKINIFYSFKAILWQGPLMVKSIEEKIKDHNINFIVESKTDVGLTLALIEIGIKQISISKKLDKKILDKIKSIAKKKEVNILFTEKFKKIQ
tara:strand:- start:156 stop:509 length:354 start_codon:yes stop_codon:yes gene_type:complete